MGLPSQIKSLPPDLRDMLAGIRFGDQTALGAFYDATVGRVYALALRITRNQADAEEVAADTYLQVWRDAARFDDARGSPGAWLMTICRSRAIDLVRRRPAGEIGAEALADAELGSSPADLVDAVERGHALHAALAALEARDRQLIALAFFRGMTHAEIAQHTGMPLGSVKTVIRRGLLALRQAMPAGLGEES